MKRNLKKIASLFISIAMAFSMLTFSCIQASAMTNQEGADWALARIGQWIDTDGYYGAQCKDFVNAFTQDNFGVTFPGNACDLCRRYPSRDAWCPGTRGSRCRQGTCRTCPP